MPKQADAKQRREIRRLVGSKAVDTLADQARAIGELRVTLNEARADLSTAQQQIGVARQDIAFLMDRALLIHTHPPTRWVRLRRFLLGGD